MAIGRLYAYIKTSEAGDKLMAKLLEEFFDVGHTKNTILNKLKDENPDFEELKNMIYSEKKRMKSKREIENK